MPPKFKNKQGYALRGEKGERRWQKIAGLAAALRVERHVSRETSLLDHARRVLPQAAVIPPDPHPERKTLAEYTSGALVNPFATQYTSGWSPQQHGVGSEVRYPPLPPLAEDVWYHGTRNNAFDPETLGQPVTERNSRHWNLGLGTFFTDNPHVASGFARVYPAMRDGGGDPDGFGRSIPARLRITNPLVLPHEADLDLLVIEKALERGVLTADDWQSVSSYSVPVEENDPQVAHLLGSSNWGRAALATQYSDQIPSDPETRRLIATRMESAGKPLAILMVQRERDRLAQLTPLVKADLIAQGYDGIVHGGNLEGGTAAIAFGQDQVEIAVGRTSHAEAVRRAVARGEPLPADVLPPAPAPVVPEAPPAPALALPQDAVRMNADQLHRSVGQWLQTYGVNPEAVRANSSAVNALNHDVYAHGFMDHGDGEFSFELTAHPNPATVARHGLVAYTAKNHAQDDETWYYNPNALSLDPVTGNTYVSDKATLKSMPVSPDGDFNAVARTLLPPLGPDGQVEPPPFRREAPPGSQYTGRRGISLTRAISPLERGLLQSGLVDGLVRPVMAVGLTSDDPYEYGNASEMLLYPNSIQDLAPDRVRVSIPRIASVMPSRTSVTGTRQMVELPDPEAYYTLAYEPSDLPASEAGRAFAAPERKIKGKSGYTLREVKAGVRRWTARRPAPQAEPQVQAQLVLPHLVKLRPGQFEGRLGHAEKGVSDGGVVFVGGQPYYVKDAGGEHEALREVTTSVLALPKYLGAPTAHNSFYTEGDQPDFTRVASRMVTGRSPGQIQREVRRGLPAGIASKHLLDDLRYAIAGEGDPDAVDFDKLHYNAGRLSAYHVLIGNHDSALLGGNPNNLIIRPDGLPVGIDHAYATAVPGVENGDDWMTTRERGDAMLALAAELQRAKQGGVRDADMDRWYAGFNDLMTRARSVDLEAMANEVEASTGHPDVMIGDFPLIPHDLTPDTLTAYGTEWTDDPDSALLTPTPPNVRQFMRTSKRQSSLSHDQLREALAEREVRDLDSIRHLIGMPDSAAVASPDLAGLIASPEWRVALLNANPDGRSQLVAVPSEIPDRFMRGRLSRWTSMPGWYDPSVLHVPPGETRFALRPGVQRQLYDDVTLNEEGHPLDGRPGHLYRGGDGDEWEALLRDGRVASKGEYNFDVQSGETLFSLRAGSAESYADSFAPLLHKARPNRAGFVMEVATPGTDRLVIRPETPSERGITGGVKASEITRAWRVPRASFEPISMDVYHERHDDTLRASINQGFSQRYVKPISDEETERLRSHT